MISCQFISFSDPAEKTMHDKMISLVERMLALHKQTPSALSGTSPKFQSAEFRGAGRTPPRESIGTGTSRRWRSGRLSLAADKAIDRFFIRIIILQKESRHLAALFFISSKFVH